MGRGIFGKYQRKLSKTMDNAPTEKSSNGREPCSENAHEDHEEITPGKFPFAEIFPPFMDKFDLDTMNIFSGRTMSNSHHIKGEGAKSRRDFQSFKACFCLEWILVPIKGALYWVRCGNMFNLYSQGCINHPRAQYKEGPNKLYYRLARNLSGTWQMIKNAHLEGEEADATEEQTLAQAQADAAAVCEQMAVVSQKGESIEELEMAHHRLMQVIAKSHKEKSKAPRHTVPPHQDGQSKASQSALAQGLRTTINTPPIYGNRRRAGNSAPGNLVLDKKRSVLNDSNNKYKSNAHFGTLANISEEGQATERRKPKKKNQGVNGPHHGIDRM